MSKTYTGKPSSFYDLTCLATIPNENIKCIVFNVKFMFCNVYYFSNFKRNNFKIRRV